MDQPVKRGRGRPRKPKVEKIPQKRGRKPKYFGMASNKAVWLSFPEDVREDLRMKARQEGYTDEGGTVDYVRYLVLKTLYPDLYSGGAAVFSVPENRQKSDDRIIE